MAEYYPPREDLPIFNADEFEGQVLPSGGGGGGGTFLEFPNAQGKEFLLEIDVAGTADFQAVANFNTDTTFDGTMTINTGAKINFQNTGRDQDDAFTGAGGLAGTFKGADITIDANGKITAIASGTNNQDNLLSSDNTWTNTNTFNAVSLATTPASTSNDRDIPTTAWVNTAISTAIANIQPTQPTGITWYFDGTISTNSIVIPPGCVSYGITIVGVPGLPGDQLIYIDNNETYLQLGGQGGGGGSGQNLNIPVQPGEIGATLTGSGSPTGIAITSSFNLYYAQVGNGGNGTNSNITAANPTGAGGGLGGAGGFGALSPGNYNWGPTIWTIGSSGVQGAPAGPPVNLTTQSGLLPPYAQLNPVFDYSPNSYTYGAAGSLTNNVVPFLGYVLGEDGMGGLYASSVNGGGTQPNETYPNSTGANTNYYGYYGYKAVPLPPGRGYIQITFNYSPQGQLGGTNSSFIAYDDPDPALKTKQIYTDKEGLAVSQDMNTSIKTTTLTPTDLKYDDGTLIQATIQDIINKTNNPDTDTLQSVLNNGNTALNADLILITSANDQQIKLNGTSANGIQITNPSTGTYPYCVMGISGFSQGSSATSTLQASNNLVRVYNNSLGNPAETSIRSGVATLGETNITAQSNGVGYSTTPTIQVFNTNSTAGNTTGVPSVEFYKSGRNGAVNDVVSSIQFNAKDGAGTKRTFGKIESTITTNTAPSNYDGALDFYSLINGVNNLVFRLNGADNENNSFRPLDLNGNELKTSQGDMLITTTASSGTGNMSITAKGGLSISNVPDNISLASNTTISAQKTLTLSRSAGIVSNQILNGESLTSTDLTNAQNTILDTNALTIGDTGSATTYSINGFANNTNSIACDTTNGFRLISGTNSSQQNLTTLQIYNDTTTQDTILLQNTGSGNPVFNLVSNNTSINLQEQSGMSVSSVGLLRTDTTTSQSQSFSMDNNSASGGVIQFNTTLNSFPMVLQTNTDLTMNVGTNLNFNGASLQSNTAGGTSGEHLVIYLNGVQYKIKLENP